MTEQTPTDAEVDSLVKAEMQAYFDGEYMDHGTVKERLNDFARAVLAKFGNQPAGEVQKRVFLVATGEEYEGDATYTRHDDAPPPLCDSECLFTTPQPTHAQAGAVPLTEAQIDDMHSEANRGYCIELEHYTKAVRDTERAHGIKGGQHE